MEKLEKLLEIIKTLRGENGCSWDKAQTIETLTNSLIEETYELVDSIDEGNSENLREELGDLIFLSLFIAYIGTQEKRFSLDDVIDGVNEKLIRRHPHVFGDLKEKDIKNILRNWESIKSREKKSRKTIYEAIPKRLPEIHRFFKIMDKLSRNGEKFEEIDEKNLSEDFKKAISMKDEKSFISFLKSFLIFCYLNKIDLPYLIRKSEKFLVKN
ncbi:MAG: MazG family protein [Brevinematia bacterium]